MEAVRTTYDRVSELLRPLKVSFIVNGSLNNVVVVPDAGRQTKNTGGAGRGYKVSKVLAIRNSLSSSLSEPEIKSVVLYLCVVTV